MADAIAHAVKNNTGRIVTLSLSKNPAEAILDYCDPNHEHSTGWINRHWQRAVSCGFKVVKVRLVEEEAGG